MSVEIFTFKSGLLSRLAHDLRLRCERWRVEVDAGSVRATFDPRTLRVDGVMRDGVLDRDGLSPGDYRKIEATIRDEILATARHDTIVFTGSLEPTGDDVTVRGQLELAGRTAAIPTTRARRRGDAWILELELVPTRWGIAPYRALAGTLKLQDRVRVRVQLPAVADVSAAAGTHAFTP